MKKGHILTLVLAAVALSLVVSTFKGATRYLNEEEKPSNASSDPIAQLREVRKGADHLLLRRHSCLHSSTNQSSR